MSALADLKEHVREATGPKQSLTLTAEAQHDLYSKILRRAKEQGGVPASEMEQAARYLDRRLYPLERLRDALLDMAASDDPELARRLEKKRGRKDAAKDLTRAYGRGARNRAASDLDLGGLKRVSDLAEREYSVGLNLEAHENVKRQKAAERNGRSIRESMFTHEQLRDEPSLPDLIAGVLPQAAMATFVGPSGIGKSAAMLSVAAAVAMGKPWMGRETDGGPVIYLLGEGGRGISKRLDAASAGFYKGKPIRDLHVIRRPIDMSDTAGEVEELRAIVAEIDPALIVWDTLIRYAGGANENDASAISVVLSNMEWVARAGTRTTGVAVHHTGHEGTRARGSSAIYANVDAELTLSGEPSALKLTATKMKDGADGLIGEFRLKESPLYESIVFEGIAPGQGKPSGAQAARVEEALAHFARAYGETGATRSELRDDLVRWMSVDRSTAQRYIGDLIADRRLAGESRGRSTFLTLSSTPTTFPIN